MFDLNIYICILNKIWPSIKPEKKTNKLVTGNFNNNFSLTRFRLSQKTCFIINLIAIQFIDLVLKYIEIIMSEFKKKVQQHFPSFFLTSTAQSHEY
jgi:hypothetical protein